MNKNLLALILGLFFVITIVTPVFSKQSGFRIIGGPVSDTTTVRMPTLDRTLPSVELNCEDGKGGCRPGDIINTCAKQHKTCSKVRVTTSLPGGGINITYVCKCTGGTAGR